MIEDDTPTLWELRKYIGHAATIAILVKAFIHAAKLVNLDKNLTEEQIGEAANDILEEFGHLKVEEIKFLLKRALRTQNVYGRLDYNVLMNWVEAYDSERTEEAIGISEQDATQLVNEIKPSDGAMSFEEYLANLEVRAKTDSNAAERLKEYQQKAQKQDLKDQEFKEWKRTTYLSQNRQQNDIKQDDNRRNIR